MSDAASPETASPESAPPLVSVRDLQVRFRGRSETVYAVNGVDFDLPERRVLCILGESGSGKSVLLRQLIRLNPGKTTEASGEVTIAGHDIGALDERSLSDIRGKQVAMIFQDSMTAFDPVVTIGRQITETILRHEPVSGAEADHRALELLERVQIPSAKRRLGAYPHELSGGLRQRAMIAMALCCGPRLLLADEPTTALDATVQIQILFLLRQLQEELGMGVIFVTHDLGVAAEIADRIAVMYAGRFVEEASVDEFLDRPLHPYARGLLGATVEPEHRGSPLTTIRGAPPRLTEPPSGCAFAPRCDLAGTACLAGVPSLRGTAGHQARCVHVTAVAA